MFRDWLEKTLALQREAYQTDPPALRGEERAEYLRWNVLAADDELHEFLNETHWKPWGKNQGELKDRGKAVEELVDALHFVANLLCALEVTDAELSQLYEAKMYVNRQRMASKTYVG